MRTTLSALLSFSLMTVTLTGMGSCGGAGEKGDPGETGAPGEKGEKGDPATGEGGAAVSLLVPASSYAGRTALVQISGVGTHFVDGTSVDFGDPGIKVRSVQAGSSANLRALIEIGVEAQPGAHDVKVMSPQPPSGGDAEQVVLKGGFTVSPSLIAELTGGAMMPAKVPQGGIVDVAVRNIDDRDNPFSTTPGQTPQLVLGPLPVGSPSISTTRYSYVGLVDALAPAGGLRIGLLQKDRQGQNLGHASDSADKNAPLLMARPATELTSGMAKSGEVLGPAAAGLRATNLYKLTTAVDNQAVHLAFSGLGSALSVPYMPPRNAGIAGYLAPSSGQFRDGRAFESSETPGMVAMTVSARNALLLLPKAGDYYFVVHATDLSGSMNHGYTLTGRWATATNIGSLKEPMPEDSTTMPLGNIMLLDKPYFGTDGAADKNFDEDFIRFKAGKTGRVYVALQTTPGLSMGLGLRGGDCTAILAQSRYSTSGNVLNEVDVTEGITYCVRIAGNGQPAPYQFVISPTLN
jgi:hypothetical protein